MTCHFTPPEFLRGIRKGIRRGSAILILSLITIVVVAAMGLGLAQMQNVSVHSIFSSANTIQAQHFAKSKMDYLLYHGYGNLAVQQRAPITDSSFADSVTLGNVVTEDDGVSRRLVTVNVYYGDETSARASLQQVFYSNDVNRFVQNDSNPTDSISLQYENNRISAKVNGIEKEIGGVPVGTVLSWYGKLSDMPDGFALCDGTNGTPDLRDRFVVGAGGEYALGDTGGEKKVKLEATQIGSHYHYWGYEQPGNNSGSFIRHNGNVVLDSSMLPVGAGVESWNGSHYSGGFRSMTSYTANTMTSLAVATAAQKPHENRPPYYALWYIMKIKRSAD